MKSQSSKDQAEVNTKPQRKVLIVDDNRFFRDIVRTILEREPFFYKVWEASSVVQATYLLDTLKLDVALVDARLAGQETGLDVVEHISRERINIPILGITTYEGSANLLHMVRSGMKGILLKTKMGPHELGEAIQMVMRGETYLPTHVKKILDEHPADVDLPAVRLTEKEKEYLKSVENGLDDKDISKRIKMSFSFVLTMSKNLYERTGTRTPSQLIAYAYRNGLLQ